MNMLLQGCRAWCMYTMVDTHDRKWAGACTACAVACAAVACVGTRKGARKGGVGEQRRTVVGRRRALRKVGVGSCRDLAS